MLGAPHFEKKPCLNLPQFSHETWNHLAFDMSNANELAQNSLNYIKNQFDLQTFADIDFSGYVHDRTLIDDYDCNWKTFIEVYLEDYHVLPFHPGLGNLVDCDDLKWEFSDYHSVQTVSSTPDLNEAGSSAYRQYQQKILELNGGKAPKQGAIWFLLYPNVMIEWYPFVLTVSTVWPQGVNKTRNVVEFYYPEEIACFERDLVEAQQNAYMETAREDDEIAKRMEAGRKSLWQRGAPLAEQIGPYQPHFEKGMFKFHEYLRKHLQCY
jgi:phenylpropionate dioxygenase-like ring-hydroxylating dioxygenase large terminal subunit